MYMYKKLLEFLIRKIYITFVMKTIFIREEYENIINNFSNDEKVKTEYFFMNKNL